MPTVAQVKERIQELLEERADDWDEKQVLSNGSANSAEPTLSRDGLWTASRPGHSTEELATILGRRAVHISASGLCQRFTEEAATLLLRLLEEAVALGLEAADAAPVDLLARFDAVVIEDSSTIRLPDKLADLWKVAEGDKDKVKRALNCMCGGISSKADSRGRC